MSDSKPQVWQVVFESFPADIQKCLKGMVDSLVDKNALFFDPWQPDIVGTMVVERSLYPPPVVPFESLLQQVEYLQTAQILYSIRWPNGAFAGVVATPEGKPERAVMEFPWTTKAESGATKIPKLLLGRMNQAQKGGRTEEPATLADYKKYYEDYKRLKAENARMSQKRIAEKIGVDESTLKRAIKAIEAQGR